MLLTVPQAGRSGRFFVRLVQVLPPSRVSCTWPSLVPAHSSPCCLGDSASAKMTPAYSTPMLSGVRPPEMPMRLRSLSVRSGLITCQPLPPLVVTCTTWLATYTRLWSNGEMTMGNSQLKRYFTSEAGAPAVVMGHTSTLRVCPFFSLYTVTTPPIEPEPVPLDHTMLGSTGSGVANPASPPPTSCQ